MRTLIKNGRLVLEDRMITGDVLVEDEVIVRIDKQILTDADQVIDAAGMIVIPGGIYVHTHFNIDVGVRAVDDFTSGTMAAAFGGTTTIVDHMGFGPKGCNLHHQLGVYEGYTKNQCVVDYGLHGVIQDVDEQILDEMDTMVSEGIASFKIYLTYNYKVDDMSAIKVLSKLKRLDAVTTVHCENDAVLNYLREKFVKEGKTEAKYHPLSRPNECEAEAVNRMIVLADTADNAPLYIVHVSTKEAENLIREAKEKGQQVYGETCPQYLLLDESAYDDPVEGLKYIMSPPLRKSADREALWKGLREGSLLVVATDHCTFDFHGDKQAGKDDFTKCPNGGPGVETRMPLIFSEGVSKGRLSLEQFVKVTSTNPAKIFGLYPKKGVLAVGSDADLVFIDPEKEVTITKKILHEKVDYTPYEGFTVKGWPVRTMLRGRIIVENDELKVKPGYGRYVARHR